MAASLVDASVFATVEFAVLLWTRLRGLDDDFEVEILPAKLANRLSDRGLVAEILARDPWLVGWTCYLWNVERSLEISALVKQQRSEIRERLMLSCQELGRSEISPGMSIRTATVPR